MNFMNEKKYLISYIDENNELQEITILASNEKDAIDQVVTFFTINGKKIDRSCITVTNLNDDYLDSILY